MGSLWSAVNRGKVSLIGMSVIPGKTACYHCGRLTIEERQGNELDDLRKLARLRRNIGNLGPLAAISASFAVSEVIRAPPLRQGNAAWAALLWIEVRRAPAASVRSGPSATAWRRWRPTRVGHQSAAPEALARSGESKAQSRIHTGTDSCR